MEDSKKNKERKVLTDEELEQVSGGRVAFWKDGDSFPCDRTIEKHYCVHYECHWSDKLNKCFYNATDAANEEAKAGV